MSSHDDGEEDGGGGDKDIVIPVQGCRQLTHCLSGRRRERNYGKHLTSARAPPHPRNRPVDTDPAWSAEEVGGPLGHTTYKNSQVWGFKLYHFHQPKTLNLK